MYSQLTVGLALPKKKKRKKRLWHIRNVILFNFTWFRSRLLLRGIWRIRRSWTLQNKQGSIGLIPEQILMEQISKLAVPGNSGRCWLLLQQQIFRSLEHWGSSHRYLPPPHSNYYYYYCFGHHCHLYFYFFFLYSFGLFSHRNWQGRSTVFINSSSVWWLLVGIVVCHILTPSLK